MAAPKLLRDRSPRGQVVLAVGIPFGFGAVVGIVLGNSATAYWILLAAAAIGGLLAGLDHNELPEALSRGAISGSMFGLGILFTHALADTTPKVSLGNFPPALIVIDAIAGALLATVGCWMLRRSRLVARIRPRAQEQ